MKKFLLSATVILTFLAYALHQRFETENVSPVLAPPTSTNNSPSPTQNPGFQPTTIPAGTGSYKNGVYTGSVADAFYGNVQVRATITGGKISDVQFLQYPNDRNTSVMINSQAMPYLTQEAIQSQNAQVDIVSGATQTSRAFRESLQSALDQAKI